MLSILYHLQRWRREVVERAGGSCGRNTARWQLKRGLQKMLAPLQTKDLSEVVTVDGEVGVGEPDTWRSRVQVRTSSRGMRTGSKKPRTETWGKLLWQRLRLT